jgi:hypothetical protein
MALGRWKQEGQRLFGRATGAFALRDEAPGEQAVALLLDVHSEMGLVLVADEPQ